MSSDDRFAFVLAALLATTVVLGVSQSRRAPALNPPNKPEVGRAWSDVPVGPMSAEALAREVREESRDESSTRAEGRVRDWLASRPWPAFARSLVFHAFDEVELPGAGLEEGPPYHAAIGSDGALRWTSRGIAGSPSQPPGLPFRAATEAVHVALPACSGATSDALASMRALWSEGVRRFGAAGVLFADEVPGSTVRLPADFDRAGCIGPQESRRAQTRPGAAATRPASRPESVTLGFAGERISATIASDSNARATGMMGRTSLEPEEGMLFVYRAAEPHSFWMKGCFIALDIIFVADDGTVLSVVTAPPPDPKTSEASLPRYESPAPCRLVLEIAGGRAAKMALKRGSRLSLPDTMPKLFERAEP